MWIWEALGAPLPENFLGKLALPGNFRGKAELSGNLIPDP